MNRGERIYLSVDRDPDVLFVKFEARKFAKQTMGIRGIEIRVVIGSLEVTR